MTTTESYHAFLIKHRHWCNYSNGWTMCYEPATEVLSVHGLDEVYCSKHAQRLKAARKSDAVFDRKETVTPNINT